MQLTSYLRARLRPKVAVTADPVTGLVTVKGKVPTERRPNSYQYRTFEPPSPQIEEVSELELELLSPWRVTGLVGFNTCGTCGALYASICLACESGFTRPL